VASASTSTSTKGQVQVQVPSTKSLRVSSTAKKIEKRSFLTILKDIGTNSIVPDSRRNTMSVSFVNLITLIARTHVYRSLRDFPSCVLGCMSPIKSE